MYRDLRANGIPRAASACVRLLGGMVLALAFSMAASAQARPTEYQLKAAYLYNFGKFVRWPSVDASKPDFNLCVLGEDPFGSDLDTTVANGTIEGKRLTVTRISKPEQAKTCQIAFIARSESRRLEQDLRVLNKLGVLTVSDMTDFAQRGGMIQFVAQENRVRFEVNLAATQDAGLTLSSELLKVAVKVLR